jgi:hypothetical protein
MTRALMVFVLAALFAGLPAWGSCYAQTGGAPPDNEALTGIAAPPAPQTGSSGMWVQVPGESIGGTWVPPHWAWSPGPGASQPPRYAPVGAYVVLPPPPFGSILADVIFLRPLGIAGLALGTAAAVVAAPFALPSGSMDAVGRTLIVAPYDFTFRRPVGVW